MLVQPGFLHAVAPGHISLSCTGWAVRSARGIATVGVHTAARGAAGPPRPPLQETEMRPSRRALSLAGWFRPAQMSVEKVEAAHAVHDMRSEEPFDLRPIPESEPIIAALRAGI